MRITHCLGPVLGPKITLHPSALSASSAVFLYFALFLLKSDDFQVKTT